MQSDKKPVDMFATGGIQLVFGLIIALAGISLLLHMLPSVRFLLKNGELNEPHKIQISELSQRTSDYITVEAEIEAILSKDYLGGPNDNFQNTRVIYAMLGNEEVGAILLVETNEAYTGKLGYYPSEQTSDPKSKNLATGGRQVFSGVIDFAAPPREILESVETSSLSEVPVFFMKQMFPPKWQASGSFFVLSLSFFVFGIALCVSGFKNAKNYIL